MGRVRQAARRDRELDLYTDCNLCHETLMYLSSRPLTIPVSIRLTRYVYTSLSFALITKCGDWPLHPIWKETISWPISSPYYYFSCYHKKLAHLQHYGESARCKNAERRNECSNFDITSSFIVVWIWRIEEISTPNKAGHRSLPSVEFLGLFVHLGWVLGHLRSINLDTRSVAEPYSIRKITVDHSNSDSSPSIKNV